MNLRTGEQAARIDTFDTLVENTVAAFNDPLTRQLLGATAARLTELAATFFLPNFSRSGSVSLPKRQQGTANIPLVPVARRQAAAINTLVEPLQDTWIFSKRAWALGYSATYGYRFSADDLLATYARDDSSNQADRASSSTMPQNAIARASAASALSEDGKAFLSTRPVLLARQELAERSPASQGAIMGHELSHCDDILLDGALYSIPLYGVASEFRAYHTSARMSTDVLEQDEYTENSFNVEAIREIEAHNFVAPFVPNQALFRHLLEQGIF